MLKSVYDTNGNGKVDVAENAEKLDGQQSSYYLDWNNLTNVPSSFPPADHNHSGVYAPYGHGLGQNLSSVVKEVNTLYLPGFSYSNSGDTNKPSGTTDGSTLTLGFSSSWVNQMYQDWRQNGQPYFRSKNNGVWGTWHKAWTAANFNPATKAESNHNHDSLYHKKNTPLTWNDLKGV